MTERPLPTSDRGRAPDSASAHDVAPPATSRFLWPVTVLVLLVLAVAAAGSWRDLAAQRRAEARLTAEIERTEARIEALEVRIEAIDSDPVALDRLARRELGYVAPGDVVFVFAEEGDTVSAPRPMIEGAEPGATEDEPRSGTD